MLEVKNSRKRAEADMKLLANRIALLRAEEEKALEKVAETKHRAEDILRLKKRNEDLAQQKHVQQMEREMKLKAAREKAQREKEERKKKLDMTKTHILHERRQMV